MGVLVVAGVFRAVEKGGADRERARVVGAVPLVVRRTQPRDVGANVVAEVQAVESVGGSIWYRCDANAVAEVGVAARAGLVAVAVLRRDIQSGDFG